MHPFRWRRESRAQHGAILVLLATCVPCVLPQAHASVPFFGRHDDRLHKEIEDLDSQWRNALIHNNVDVMSGMLADDYLGINPNGTLETKADAVELHRSGAVKISSITPDDLKVRIYGDTAVVTSKVDLKGQDGDRDISGSYRYTRVYSRRLGEWKIVSFESSRLQPRGTH